MYPNQFKSGITLALVPIKDAIKTLWNALNDAVENMIPFVMSQFVFAITIMIAFLRILQELAGTVFDNVTK